LQLLLLVGLTVLWGGWRTQATKRILLVSLLVYVLAVWILPLLAGLDWQSRGILSRFSDGGEACASRKVLWSNVLYLIAQKPWFGWGWGELDYAHFMTLYPGERFCDMLDNAHNLPLHLAVELGVPVSALVCGGLLWLIMRARPWAEHDPKHCLAWGVLAVIALHSLLEYPLWYGPFQMAVGLCVILLWRKSESIPMRRPMENNSEVAKVKSFPYPLTSLVTAGVLPLALLFAAWDYYRVSQIYLEPGLRSPAYRDNTLEKIRGTLLFRDQYHFAELTLTPLTQANAQEQNAMAKSLLHYSPEAAVVEKITESAMVLKREDEALFFLQRYQAAYPKQHASWARTQGLSPQP
jgi:hypothetical protein